MIEMQDYYNTANKKVIDFFKGFFLNIGIGAILLVVNFATGMINFGGSVTLLTRIMGIIVPLIFISLEIFLIKKFFMGKRYIAIGMLSSLLLPLLLAGFCSVMFLRS
jgi:hypothetical protein